MSEFKVGATARVRVLIEVPVKSSWGHDCTAAQVYRQAKDDATGYLRNLVEPYRKGNGLRVIGEPQVEMVVAPQN